MNILSFHSNCSINNEVQTKRTGDLLDQYMILMILPPFGLKRSGQGEIVGTWPRVHKYNKGTQISFRLVYYANSTTAKFLCWCSVHKKGRKKRKICVARSA
jgi:hypothetical protein